MRWRLGRRGPVYRCREHIRSTRGRSPQPLHATQEGQGNRAHSSATIQAVPGRDRRPRRGRAMRPLVDLVTRDVRSLPRATRLRARVLAHGAIGPARAGSTIENDLARRAERLLAAKRNPHLAWVIATPDCGGESAAFTRRHPEPTDVGRDRAGARARRRNRPRPLSSSRSRSGPGDSRSALSTEGDPDLDALHTRSARDAGQDTRSPTRSGGTLTAAASPPKKRSGNPMLTVSRDRAFALRIESAVGRRRR